MVQMVLELILVIMLTWKMVHQHTQILSLPTRSELSGGTDDYAVTAGELKTAYDRFLDTESLDVNLILGGRGGGSGDSSSTQDTHVTMLTIR